MFRGEFQLITPILGFIFGGQTLGPGHGRNSADRILPDRRRVDAAADAVAAFTADNLTGEAPFAVSFDGTSSQGVPTDFLWDFGDGVFAGGDAK